MQIALIQHSCSRDVETNIKNIESRITDAAKSGCDLVILPELHSSVYFCQQEAMEYFDLAESIPGPATQWLSSLAKKFQIVIVGSLFEKRQPGLYHNTAVVLDSDGNLAGRYRKMHIPDDPGYYEKYYFTPGDMGFTPIQTSIGKLGIQVCWDQWYPEGARLLALAGAQLLIYPTAIGWEPDDSNEEKQRQLQAWITIQRSHAIANGIPVVAVNRHGLEEGDQKTKIDFWGNSFICDGFGKVLAQAGNDNDETLLVDVNVEETDTIRRVWPFLRDRRIDAYNDLTKRAIDTDIDNKS